MRRPAEAAKSAMRASRHGLARVLLAVSLCLLGGCAWFAPAAELNAARARAGEARANPGPNEYYLWPGDRLNVKFFYNQELNDVVEIRPDGEISLQLVHEVQAAGTTPRQLREKLAQMYTKFLEKPEVNVNIETYRSMVVYVGGQVRAPGIIPLAPGMTALRAILAAGGDLYTGDMDKVLVIRDKHDGTPSFMMLDLTTGANRFSSAEDLRLNQRDIVIVPTSGITEADRIVQQYINELLPLGKSFNLNYNFGIPQNVGR